ncbi:MAG: hypothetical protein R3286_16665 [Gammaproteobacteria bacterium]|nr:hypothetical protein [Gammaproteobacteria bacterium]
MHATRDRELPAAGPADRFPGRQDGDAPAPPAGTRLFRVVTRDGEWVIGLTCGQLACLGTTTMSRLSPGSWRRRLDRVGFLAVWRYDVGTTPSGRTLAAPLRQVPLFAADVLRMEHYEHGVAGDRLALAA